MINVKTAEMSGWGLFPRAVCREYQPERLADIRHLLSSAHPSGCISRGLGRSYGDAALNERGGVISHLRLCRFLAFDAERGILECEAGVSIEEINEYFIPRGFFPPVTPGTKYVTIGGAIANDVHGKNHHQHGCISEFVLDFQLMLASGETVECSRTRHAELFWATIGGLGLTGIILSARIQLLPIETAYMQVRYRRAANLEEALALFAAEDERYPYSVAWIDCLASGRALGRSVLMRGTHAAASELTRARAQAAPLRIKPKMRLNVPFYFPSFTLNQRSIALFNSLYYRSFKHKDTLLVDYDSFFYPLDAIAHWNRLYGRKGFLQYQAVFPASRSREGLTAMLEMISRAKLSSFLAVLKSSGERNKGLLSFPLKGHTLALDIPIKGPSIFAFMRQLDELVIRYGGRIYLAKDAVLQPDAFQRMYAETLADFIKIKREVDPAGVFSSSLARRIGLMEGER